MSPLHDLRVAAPCRSDWERMQGNQRVRYCEACALHVYNLSAMTAQEAEQVVLKKEGRLCVRFYQREDGTVLTQDCPRGLAAIRQAARHTALLIGGSVAGMFLLLFGLLGAAVSVNGRAGAQSFNPIPNWLYSNPPVNTVMGAPPPPARGQQVLGEACLPDEEPPVPPR